MNQIDEKLVWAENLRKAFIAMKREKALNTSVKVLKGKVRKATLPALTG